MVYVGACLLLPYNYMISSLQAMMCPPVGPCALLRFHQPCKDSQVTYRDSLASALPSCPCHPFTSQRS